MTEGAGEEALSLVDALGAVPSETLDPDEPRPQGRSCVSGDGETPFLLLDLALPGNEFGVHELDELGRVLSDRQVDDDHPQADPDLGGGEADPRGRDHGLVHVVEKRLDVVRHRGDGSGGRVKDTFTPLDDGPDCQGNCSSSVLRIFAETEGGCPQLPASLEMGEELKA